MLRQRKFTFRGVMALVLSLFQLFHLARDVELDLDHGYKALVVGTGHQLEHSEFIDA